MTADGRTDASLIENRPVLFGEVLFDSFPDGSALLGGAPFNVAWHLHGFGAAPLFISCVGNDERGEEVKLLLSQWGMDSSGIQTSVTHPTGLVEIALQDGQPTFSILPDQAYDQIENTDLIQNIASSCPALLYCGSLIKRSDQSAHSLKQLIDKNIPLFVDVNLRQPWWNKKSVAELVSAATWVKLNHEELALLSGLAEPNELQLQEAAEKYFNKYGLTLLIVTLGEKGAFVVSSEGIYESEPVKVPKLVDAVGAGDAFSSVMVFGILNNWSVNVTLSRASAFAATLCGTRGAIIRDKLLYQDYLKQWRE